jgi:hypothetical protein
VEGYQLGVLLLVNTSTFRWRSGSPSRSPALKGYIPFMEPALRVLTLAIGAAVVAPMVRRKQISCEELFACALHYGF